MSEKAVHDGEGAITMQGGRAFIIGNRMIWTVTYRGDGGQRNTLEIEADSRSGVFAELQRRGINAISVAEGAAKRKGRTASTMPPKAAVSSKPPRWCIIAGSVVVLGAAATWWWLANNREREVPSPVPSVKPGASTLLHEDKTKTVQTDSPERVHPETNRPAARLYKGVEVLSATVSTNGTDGAIIERLKLADGRTVKAVSLPKPLFENPSDQLIAMALSSQSGQSVAPMPIDSNVEQDFLNSLVSPIKIDEDDPDNIKELKANVLEARAYIAEEVKAGKSVREVLEAYQKQMNDIADRHLMAVQEVQKIRQQYGIDEAREFAVRVNEALRARGISEINVPK